MNAAPLAGPAPLNVTFTLDASDADGDALTWTLQPQGASGPTYSGTGADFPATIQYTYTSAGNETALFSVSDGSATSSANATITVS